MKMSNHAAPTTAAPKFTPGPWKFLAGMIVKRDESAIVGTYYDSVGGANRALIAAAPELYEALRQAEVFLLDRAHLPNGRDYADVLRNVSAALAKVAA